MLPAATSATHPGARPAWLGALFALLFTAIGAVAVGQPAVRQGGASWVALPAPTAAELHEPAGIPLPSLRAVVSPRGVILLGVVPDSLERDLIVSRAKQLYGAQRVTDLLRVGEVGNPAWLNADFLPDLRGVNEATAVLENATLLVEGEASSAEAHRRIAAAMAALRARGVSVENRLRPPAEVAATAR